MILPLPPYPSVACIVYTYNKIKARITRARARNLLRLAQCVMSFDFVICGVWRRAQRCLCRCVCVSLLPLPRNTRISLWLRGGGGETQLPRAIIFKYTHALARWWLWQIGLCVCVCILVNIRVQQLKNFFKQEKLFYIVFWVSIRAYICAVSLYKLFSFDSN